MSDFVSDTRMLLETATTCVESGIGEQDWTIFYGPEGGLRMVVGADESLESLAWERGARQAWRITHEQGMVRVEGRSNSELCRLEAPAQGPGIRALVSDVRLYELAA